MATRTIIEKRNNKATGYNDKHKAHARTDNWMNAMQRYRKDKQKAHARTDNWMIATLFFFNQEIGTLSTQAS